MEHLIYILIGALVGASVYSLGKRKGGRDAESVAFDTIQALEARIRHLGGSLSALEVHQDEAEKQISSDKDTISKLAVRVAEAEGALNDRLAEEAASEWEESAETDPVIRAYLDNHDLPIVWPVPTDVAGRTLGLRHGIVEAWVEEFEDVKLSDGRIDLIGLLSKRMADRCPEEFSDTGITTH